MSASDAIPVTLPGGCWHDGRCYREAALRPLVGEDEAFLLEAGAALLPAAWTTAVLARCLARLGPPGPVTPEAVRSLAVGDREALLLHLRRLTAGERLPCVLACPAAGCGAPMDLDLRAGDLLLPPYPEAPPVRETTMTEDGTTWRIAFRLPTGADQEAAAELARADSGAAAAALLRRCVVGVTSESGAAGELPVGAAERLAALMAEQDPQAELLLSLTCPACGHAFTALFDTASYLMQEVARRGRQLYREVHSLAFHYHWGEGEIMAMPARKRQLYLELLAEALAERAGR
jgi:hypothetical protein